MQLLLPSELKRLIVELCSDSPSSLAALARTHSTYQREAEMALYETILIEDTVLRKCIETLAKNPKKAAFVRSLVIEYDYYTMENRITMNNLLKILINMNSLSDFRVRWFYFPEKQMKESLNKILWSVVVKFLLFFREN